MKVVVVGGSLSDGAKTVFQALDFWADRLGITTVIHSGQVGDRRQSAEFTPDQWSEFGAEYLAMRWCARRSICCTSEAISEAEKVRLGASLGEILARRIIEVHTPVRIIAFGSGSLVSSILDMARRRGIKCIEVGSPLT